MYNHGNRTVAYVNYFNLFGLCCTCMLKMLQHAYEPLSVSNLHFSMRFAHCSTDHMAVQVLGVAICSPWGLVSWEPMAWFWNDLWLTMLAIYYMLTLLVGWYYHALGWLSIVTLALKAARQTKKWSYKMICVVRKLSFKCRTTRNLCFCFSALTSDYYLLWAIWIHLISRNSTRLLQKRHNTMIVSGQTMQADL